MCMIQVRLAETWTPRNFSTLHFLPLDKEVQSNSQIHTCFCRYLSPGYFVDTNVSGAVPLLCRLLRCLMSANLTMGNGRTVMCEYGVSERAEDTPLGHACVEGERMWCKIPHPRNLWSIAEEIQNQSAQWAAPQAEVAQFLYQFMGNDSVKGRTKIHKHHLNISVVFVQVCKGCVECCVHVKYTIKLLCSRLTNFKSTLFCKYSTCL